jgi:inner membrane protein
MLALGHAGLTLGMAVLLTGVAIRESPAAAPPGAAGVRRAEGARGWRWLTRRATAWLDRLAGRVDLRVLLIGSLLPDIIDKPVGHLFFRATFSNGRIFAHTLVFLLLLAFAGLFLYRRRGRTWLSALAFGTATHLIFDQIWRQPRTLWWPAYGLTFDVADLTEWIPKMVHALFTNAAVFVPEATGAVVLALLALLLLRRRRVRAFLRHGTVGPRTT